MFVPMTLDEEQMKVLENISDEEQKRMRNACVHAILIEGQNRKPIKRQELNRLVSTGSTRSYRTLNAITVLANKQLYRYFGMRLFEIEDRTKYLLVTADPQLAANIKKTQEQKEESAVMFFILLDIFASSENKITEEEMLKPLKALELSDEKIKKHVDALVKALYITQTKDTMHPDKKFYQWGPRSAAEVDPDKFFERYMFLAEDNNPDHFPDQKTRIAELKSLPNRRLTGGSQNGRRERA